MGGLQLNNIYCGDCLDILKEIDDSSIDLIVTSPPYFNAREYSYYKTVEEYMRKMGEVFNKCFTILKESRMCIVNISPVIVKRTKRTEQSYRIPLPFYFVPMMEKIGFEFLEDIIWEKPSGSAINRNGGFHTHRKPIAYKPNIVTEYILVFKKPAPFLIDKVLKNDSFVKDDYEKTNIWKINPETKSEHPAPFPISLVDKCVRYYSYEDDTILDPFIGSGTTAVACKLTGRNFIGIELNQKYVDIANKRLQNTFKQEELI